MVKRDKRNIIANQQEAYFHIIGFKQLVIDGCVYKIHPIYDLHAASRDGKIIHIIKQDPIFGFKQPNGYMRHRVRKYGATNRKTYYVYRFVWECSNGMIPEGKVIDHINDGRADNRLWNLQFVTQQENSKKIAKKT